MLLISRDSRQTDTAEKKESSGRCSSLRFAPYAHGCPQGAYDVMNKQSLIHLLKEGLNTRRITDTDYNHALDLYALIYEEKVESETSTSHAELASIITLASGLSPTELKKMSCENRECVIEAELTAAEEYLLQHPILQLSPADLERKHRSIADYLSQPCWTSKDLELWKEYYDV